ncbi:MAG: prenyltransferase/squalene oxidase repeat-containing protein [Kiritimatiellia bacterium]
MSLSYHARRILDHVWGPTGSVILHILIVILLVKFMVFKVQEKTSDIEVFMVDPDAQDLDEFEKELEILEDIPEVTENITTDVNIEMEAPPDPTQFDSPEPEMDLSALNIDDVKSPLIMKGLFSGRSAGGRAAMLGKHSGKWGAYTEPAVIKALEWLKNHQLENGSWNATGGAGGGDKPQAMTGLALLAFLAHGETTASEKYGRTVERAIKYLVSSQQADGMFCRPRADNSEYIHGIATYAISEAYGLTRIPALKDSMERAVDVIIKGQQPIGSWNYFYEKNARYDTSVTGWQLQALKAAYIAGASNPGLKACTDKAVEYLKKANMSETGQFAYRSDEKQPGRWIGGSKTGAPTGAAVLCMQLLGYGETTEAKKGLVWLREANCTWSKDGTGYYPLYEWYYITQAKFHEGGQQWNSWNNDFARVFVGEQKPDGSWVSPGENEEPYGPVYGTVFCALTLQVYYRFLPTYQTIEVEPVDETEEDDVVVEII